MRLSVVRNKKGIFILVCGAILFMLLPVLVTVITKTLKYSTIVLKILEIIILISSFIYTYNVFNNQIKRNVMFGITRKETYKKWAVKIDIIGFLVICASVINSVIAAIVMKQGETIGEALIASFFFLEGFYCYFILNFLVFYVISKNKEERIRRKVLLIFIIGVLVSIFFCFEVFYFMYDLPGSLQTILFHLYVGDMFAGPVIALIGFILIYFIEKIHIKGILYKGEY